MTQDYDNFFKHVGINDDEDKKIVFDFMDTLFDITINIMNNNTETI